MLRDIASQKKIDRQCVIDAIEALKSKGWDINPYTVADQAKIPRTAVYRDAELMDLINAAPRPATLAQSPETATQLDMLQKHNQELESLVKELQAQKETLSFEAKQAWQLGYEAGRKETWAERDQTDTTGSAEISGGWQASHQSPELIELEMAQEAAIPAEAQLQESAPPEALFYDSEHDLEESDSLANSIDTQPSNDSSDDSSDAPGDQPDLVPPELGQPEVPVAYEFLESETPAESEAAYLQEHSFAEPQEAELADDPEAQMVSQDALRDLLKHQIDNQQAAAKEADASKKASGRKFVGSGRSGQDAPPAGFVMRSVPPDIRKACLILGLRPEEITRDAVHKAWRKEITNPGGHPDIGGETEIAIYLNTAKDTLYTFLDAQEPKLGKKFGAKEPKSAVES